MFRKVPIIVILGSTGTGKTKLSIELAQRFGGEIISADSMQVYKGLNIVTAKATAAEQATSPHHLLDIVQPGKPFTVVDFRDAALPVVENLLKKSKIPIVVGGTNYYIESLLWQVLVNPPSNSAAVKRKLSADEIDSDKRFALTEQHSKEQPARNEEYSVNISDDELKGLDSSKLHDMLKSVDSQTAEGLHPNNRRKIIRALEVFRDIGKPLSSILQEQRNTPGGSYLGGPLRYEHVIIFWLRCEQEILNNRLDKRIADMVAQGLLKEIRTFYDSLTDVNHTKDYSKGILQTIGFKEFIPYLEKYGCKEDELITEYITTKPADAAIPEGLALLQSCLDELGLVTKRYSKKQIKWISNRFLANTDRHVPPLYGLDTSHPCNWDDDVFKPSEQVIDCYLNEKECSVHALERHNSPRAGLTEQITNICNICERHFIGEYQWNIHLRSKKHWRSKAKKEKTTMAC